MKSSAFSLNIEDYKRIVRNIVVMYWPVILVLLSQAQNWVYDTKVLYASFIWITIDVIRRYINEVK
jgi:hypothetical protein